LLQLIETRFQIYVQSLIVKCDTNMKNQLKAVKTKLEITLRYQTKNSLTWNSKTH